VLSVVAGSRATRLDLTNMCAYECHQIGGPWIAENPECPIHSNNGHRQLIEGIQDPRKLYELLGDLTAHELHIAQTVAKYAVEATLDNL
jgi:hypothetical protein